MRAKGPQGTSGAAVPACRGGQQVELVTNWRMGLAGAACSDHPALPWRLRCLLQTAGAVSVACWGAVRPASALELSPRTCWERLGAAWAASKALRANSNQAAWFQFGTAAPCGRAPQAAATWRSGASQNSGLTAGWVPPSPAANCVVPVGCMQGAAEGRSELVASRMRVCKQCLVDVWTGRPSAKSTKAPNVAT